MHFTYDDTDCLFDPAAEAKTYLEETIWSQVFLAELDRDEDRAMKMWGADADLSLSDIKEHMERAAGRTRFREFFAVVDIEAEETPASTLETILHAADPMKTIVAAARGIDHRHIPGLPKRTAAEPYLLVYFAAFSRYAPEADVRACLEDVSVVAVFESARPGLATEILAAVDSKVTEAALAGVPV